LPEVHHNNTQNRVAIPMRHHKNNPIPHAGRLTIYNVTIHHTPDRPE
jgi:hypothetical protein